jgi:hypothetical protein
MSKSRTNFLYYFIRLYHGGMPVVSKSGYSEHINLLQIKPCAKRPENMKVYVKPHN